jgi:16S rRNA (uracil1498-N3)-methyltransferase
VGEIYEAVLDQVGELKAAGRLVCRRESDSESPLKITLVQGLPKGDKLELIIQKCTELGITAIWPVQTERVVVRLDSSKAGERRKRWTRIALEAAKQCRRQLVPEVSVLQDWQTILHNLPQDAQGILLWESENNKSLRAVLSDIRTDRPIFIFVGPEGGFTQEEVHAAQARGIEAVTLGPRILRTETAGLATLAIISFQLGDLGGS